MTIDHIDTAQQVRVAVVQAAPVLFDTPKSLQKLANLTADAAWQGAELVVFPEAFIGGYYKGHDFGVSVGIRTPEGRDEFRRLFESGIEVPGPATELIGNAARDHTVHLVVGVIERDGGTLYCTALIFGPDGALLGKHRKLMPTAMERVIWGCGDGSTLPVVPTTHGKIGTVICWENYMPLLRTAMYAKGVELYCAITVDDRDTWLWQAARLFHPGDDTAARAFVRKYVLQILRGKVLSVIRSWKRLAAQRKLSPHARKQLRQMIGYFRSNRQRMHYDQYLARGYPIASGVIEGACRHYVKDRMERAGMNWIVPGAQAILDLRSVYLNDQWDDFQDFTIARELARIHPHRKLVSGNAYQMAA